MTDIFVAVSSRIRLARNVRGYAFPCVIKGTEKQQEINGIFSSVLKRTGEFDFRRISGLKELEKRSLVERYLISKKLADENVGAVAVSKDGLISVMINEEDHVREQIIYRGLELEKAYLRISNLDGVLRANVDFAVSGSTYYTACPSNLGTGMRASVMLFLPAHTAYGKIEPLSKQARDIGLVVRGAFGEGSVGEGYFYQVSNEVTYNITESEIITLVKSFVESVIDDEIYLRQTMFKEDKLGFADKCFRSKGILENAVRLSYEEFIELIANVKLGVSVGIIKCENPYYIDDLSVAARSATLALTVGGAIDEAAARAKFVKENLKKLSLKTVDTL